MTTLADLGFDSTEGIIEVRRRLFVRTKEAYEAIIPVLEAASGRMFVGYDVIDSRDEFLSRSSGGGFWGDGDLTVVLIDARSWRKFTYGSELSGLLVDMVYDLCSGDRLEYVEAEEEIADFFAHLTAVPRQEWQAFLLAAGVTLPQDRRKLYRGFGGGELV